MVGGIVVECIYGKEVREDCEIRAKIKSVAKMFSFCKICPHLEKFKERKGESDEVAMEVM